MTITPARSTALPADEEKAAHVRRMFSSIAPRYDLLNHLLSLNIDRLWRRRAVDRLNWERRPDGTYLDNCAGTLDLSTELARRAGFGGRVVGSDFTFAMLAGGVHKLDALRVDPVCADALALPYPDAAFDGATVGFGVRNLADLDAGLREMARVLRPGARLVILEFTTPNWQPFRGLYFLYFLPHPPAGRADDLEARLRVQLSAGVGAELPRARRARHAVWRRRGSRGWSGSG